jgi:hypothetical protein
VAEGRRTAYPAATMTVSFIGRLVFGGILAVSLGACEKSSPGTTTPSGAVLFGSEGSKVGAIEVGEYTVKLDLDYTLEGLAGPRVSTSILRSARYRTEFTAARDGLPIEAKVTYLDGRDYEVDVSGVEDDKTWVSGNSYAIRVNGFETASGQSVRREEREALDRDFQRFGETGALQAQLRGKSLSVGEVVRLTPGEVMDRFPEANARLLDLRLVGFEQRCGRQIAIFDASVTVTSEFTEGVTEVALTGQAKFDVASARPVSFALKGAAVVFLEYGRPQNGDGTGSFQAAFDPC